MKNGAVGNAWKMINQHDTKILESFRNMESDMKVKTKRRSEEQLALLKYITQVLRNRLDHYKKKNRNS